MKKKVEEYLAESIGETICLERINKSLPIYFYQNYDICRSSFCERTYTFLFIKDRHLIIERMKEHMEQLNSYGLENFIFVLENMSHEQRVRLIKHKIAFIDPFRQLFIPYLFLRIDSTIKRNNIKRLSTFGPASQLVYIAIMNQKEDLIIPSLLEKKTSLSRITINRSLRELIELGLIHVSGKNTRKKYQRIHREDLWEKGKEYLVSPIKTTFLMSDSFCHDLTYTSETALSNLSMLDEPIVKNYAIYKEDKEEYEPYKTEEDMLDSYKGLARVEVWSYDPALFADKSRNIDFISLYSIFKESDDPRIEIVLEELMEDLGYEGIRSI